MTKLLILLVLAFDLFSKVLWAGSNEPLSSYSTDAYQLGIRFYKKQKAFQHLFEVSHENRPNQSDKRIFKLGSRLRVHPNLKLGLFYSHQYGKRHDADWINNPWRWRDTGSRQEEIAELELSPRFKLFHESLVLNTKVSYLYNFHEDFQTLKVGAGPSFFAEQFVLFMRYEIYQSLNFSERGLYERWTYLGASYIFSREIQFMFQFALGREYWANTNEYAEVTANSYSVKQKVNKSSFFFIYRL